MKNKNVKWSIRVSAEIFLRCFIIYHNFFIKRKRRNSYLIITRFICCPWLNETTLHVLCLQRVLNPAETLMHDRKLNSKSKYFLP